MRQWLLDLLLFIQNVMDYLVNPLPTDLPLCLTRHLKLRRTSTAQWLVCSPPRKCLINLHYVERMHAHYSVNLAAVIDLRSGTTLQVARHRWVAIRAIYKQLPKANLYVSTAQA